MKVIQHGLYEYQGEYNEKKTQEKFPRFVIAYPVENQKTVILHPINGDHSCNVLTEEQFAKDYEYTGYAKYQNVTHTKSDGDYTVLDFSVDEADKDTVRVHYRNIHTGLKYNRILEGSKPTGEKGWFLPNEDGTPRFYAKEV